MTTIAVTSKTTGRPVAVVTGAARGLGSSIADRLDQDGFEVVRLDVGAGPGVTRCDISEASEVEAVFGSLPVAPSVVVNNAGIVRFGPLMDLSKDDFQVVVNVNLLGTFHVAQAAARRMRDAGAAGSIINITSMNGIAAGPNAGAYGATKAGIALLTRQMAIEWGPLGIRVNAVAPGLIDAGMSEPIYADPEAREARSARVPLGRLGTADDIANAVSFLAGPQSSYMTGQELLVDGGVTMSIIATLPRPRSVDGVGPTGPHLPANRPAGSSTATRQSAP